MRKFSALLCDLIIGYALVSFLLSFSAYSLLFNTTDKILLRIVEVSETTYLVNLIIHILLVSSFYRFYSSLILGVSLSEWVMGMRGKSGFVWNRVGGSIRSSLEVFSLPLVIPYLPKFYKKNSFLEKLTKTDVVTSYKKLGLGLGFIWCLSCFALFIYAPFLEGLNLLDPLRVEIDKLEAKELNSGDSFQDYKVFQSNRLRMSSLSNLENDRFLLIPNFDFTKIGKKKSITAVVDIYDQIDNTVGKVKIVKKISLLKLIAKVSRRNPSFRKTYPILYKAIEDSSSDVYFRKDFSLVENKKLFSEKLIDEIYQLIKSNLLVTPANSLVYIKERGPFIGAAVEMKKKILELGLVGELPKIDYHLLGDSYFLRLYQPREEAIFETLIPVESDNSFVLQIEWRGSEKSLKSFKQSFFAPAQWFFDYKKIATFPTSKSSMNPLTIFDFYSDKKITTSQRVRLEKYIRNFFVRLGRRVSTAKSDTLKIQIISALTRMKLVTEFIKKNKNDAFIKDLALLKKTISSDEIEIFEDIE